MILMRQASGLIFELGRQVIRYSVLLGLPVQRALSDPYQVLSLSQLYSVGFLKSCLRVQEQDE